MILKVSHTSYIIGFFDNYIKCSKISKIIEDKSFSVIEDIKEQKIYDWTVDFNIVYI